MVQINWLRLTFQNIPSEVKILRCIFYYVFVIFLCFKISSLSLICIFDPKTLLLAQVYPIQQNLLIQQTP